jgi:hypothetical protein
MASPRPPRSVHGLGTSLQAILAALKSPRRTRSPETRLGLEPLENRAMLAFVEVPVAFADVDEGEVAWADYDGDGDLDALITGRLFSGNSRATELWRNDGNDVFTQVNDPFADVYRSAVAWGDYDNDGDLDLILSGSSFVDGTGIVAVTQLWNNGDGTDVNGDWIFTLVSTSFSQVYRGSVDWADFDGDDDLDLLLTGRTGINQVGETRTEIWRNLGQGGGYAFEEFTGSGLPDAYLGDARWGDVNGDGFLDVAITGLPTIDFLNVFAAVYQYNSGTGTFALLTDSIPGVIDSTIQWVDYDGDGDQDLSITGSIPASVDSFTAVYRNDAGVLTEVDLGLPDLRFSSLDWGDFDDDGDMDLLLMGSLGSDPITEVYRNNGDGTLTAMNAGLSGLYFGNVQWGDYDNDGDLDILQIGRRSSTDFDAVVYRYDNEPPVITQGASVNVTMSEDGVPTPFDVTISATDIDDIAFTWSIQTQATSGVAMVSGTTGTPTVTYTPNTNYFGSDSFVVLVNDGNGGTDSIIVNVTLNAVNDAPVITQGDSVNVVMSEDGVPTAFVPPTIIASDVDNDSLTWTLATGATNGVATVSGTGASPTITYIPTANYFGPDSFVVRVSDGNGGEDLITVNVTIDSVNDPPVIAQGDVVTVEMSENGDPDPFVPPTITASDIEGDTLTWSLATSATNGLATVTGTGASPTITYVPNVDFVGNDSFVVRVSDDNGGEDLITVNVSVGCAVVVFERFVSVPVELGNLITVTDVETGEVVFTIDPFPGFTGGVTIATGDVDGDGYWDIIVGAGAGGGPHVKVFSGLDASVLLSFFAYEAAFTGGVNVGAADIDGDLLADIITGAGPGGGPHVKVFSGLDATELQSYFAYDPAFTGGVWVAGGDINGDDQVDVITGAGAGGGPHVKVFDGANRSVLQSFFAYDPNFTGGVRVSAGDFDGDGQADIITAAGPDGGPHVKVFSGVTVAELRSFFPYNQLFTGGVFVSAGNFDDDCEIDILMGAGPGGGPDVKVIGGVDNSELLSQYFFDADFRGGVQIYGAAIPARPTAS